MKKNYLVKSFNFDLFSSKINVVFCRNSVASQVVKNITGEEVEIDECTNGIQFENLLWFDSDSHNVFVVLHEVLHLTFWLLHSRGIIYCEESEEIFCYTCQFLYMKVMGVYGCFLEKSKK